MRQAPTATLCLHMIVRNEERIITRCLESVAPYIGCWIICDTGSTDQTPRIIQDFFARRSIPGELHSVTFENFEQARNEALERARASSLGFDYLLLTDADMQLVVSDILFRQALTAPAYSVRQKTRISYWNDRLLRRDTPARYRGVTHEYLEVPAGRERLHGISFIDYAEGSSRAEKYSRDIRLLTEDLARHPDNMRSWFYLAQSFRDNGQPDEAIKAYRHRIALGGWAEEAWYARLQIARCLLKQGDAAGFVHAALQAWNERPHRAEPLYDLAHYYRELGENVPATLFSHQGMAIPWPANDALFVEDFVYEWGLREEYAICGYYVPAHRRAAASICDGLALSADVPAHVRQQARRNLRFYARPLREALPSFAAFPVGFTADAGYHPMNPSVVRWNDGLWMVQRTVNYRLTDAGDYITHDGGPVRTRNYLLRLDDDFRLTHRAELLGPSDLPPPQFGRILGFEDMRPFVWHDALWATATVREQNADGWCETFRFRIDGAGGDAPTLVDSRALRVGGERRHEKNWIIASAGKAVRFIYSVSPGRIVDEEGRTLANAAAPWAADQVRGGTQATPFGPGWLAVCHEHVQTGKRRFYLHRFVWFDRTGMPRRISEPFNILREGVEFAAGLAWHPDGKRLVLSFGCGDAESWIGHVPAADIVPLLRLVDRDAVAADKPSSIVTYWRRGEAVQNLGDFLSELFVQRVTEGPLKRYARLRLIGSVISDFIIQQDVGADPDALAGYWGCGLRDDQPVRADLRARARFHGVRGPLTRDILGLPADTPIGDPGLLMPLLHRPRPVVAHTVCVPHFHDETDDAALLERTGVRKVLRARVAGTLDALREAIDVIAGAEFVLAGALHAAVLACAYGRPFAFYDNGRVDLPFKWADFSASIGVPTVFVRTLAEARRAWEDLLAPVMRRPAVAPVLEAFPGVVRPELLAMARAWDEGGAAVPRQVDR